MTLTKNTRLKQFSTNLRQNMTEAEWKLWNILRDRTIFTVQWHRQKVIGKYICDFYCGRAKLIIEVDGTQHYEERNAQYDKKRSQFLHAKGFTVLRFPNSEVLQNMDGVMLVIYHHATQIFSPLSPISHPPSSRSTHLSTLS